MHTTLRPLYALALAVALLLGAGWSESAAQERETEQRPPIDRSARQLPSHALAADGIATSAARASAVPGAFGYGINAFDEVYDLFPLDTPSQTTTVSPISLANDFGGDFPGAGVIGDDPNTAYVAASSTLYTVDVQTGTVTQVGTLTTDFGITGLAYDTTTDTYYAVTGDFGSDPNATGSLYEIDVTTPSATLVGSLTGSDILLDAAFDDSGTLYGIDRDTDELFEIDTATGAATLVGGLGFDTNFDTGMSFDTLSGDMYFFGLRSVAGGNFAAEWYTVDLATGTATLVEALPGLAQYGWFDAEAITDPLLTVSPSTIDFGNVSTDAGATADVTLEPLGLADVDVSSLAITGPDAGLFSVAAAPGTPFTIASGTLETVTIGFDPTSGGDKTATLEITSNTGGTAGTVTTVDLSGFGVAPITSYPYAVDFENGGALPGGWSQEASPVEGKVWEFTDGVGDGFGSDHGATEDHTTGTGFYAYLEDSSPDDPPASLVTPPLDFSSLSAPRLSFWYQNAGSDTDPGVPISELRIDVSTNGGSTFDPADADLLVITQRVDDWTQFFVSLAPYGGESNVAIRFRGVETSSFESNPALDDVAVQEAPAVGEIAVSPDAIDFGTVATGSTASAAITITNNGGADLEVTDLTVAGTDAGQFQLANAPTLPVTIAPGTDATFDAVFAPTTGGDLTAQVEITSDDPNAGLVTVDLAGFGNAPVASYPYVVDFENGGVLPGGWSQETSPAGEEWQFTDGIGDGIGSDYGATEDHTTGTGFYAFLDDSTPDDAPTSLVTRPLDLSSLSVPRVSFWYQNAGSGTEATSPISELRIDVSLDGGTTFDPADADLLVITQRVDDWTQFAVDLAAYAGESSVAVRFRGVETDDFRSNPALDDVVVEEAPTTAAFAISPDTGAFGSILTTDAGAFVQTYTVTNTGAGTLTVEQPTTSGADAGTFLIGNASETFPVDLGAGGTVSFDLTLDTPVAAGTYAADLEVPYDLGDGSGTQTETIALTLTVNDPNFGGGGPGTGGYFFANSTPGAASSPSQPGVGDFSITGTPTDVTLDDDAVAGPITLPFAFRFFDADYTEVWLSSNGWLSFTDPAGASDLSNDAIPTAGDTENLIAWFWDDLDPGDIATTGGSIQYGSDADGNFVIAFDRVPSFPGDASPDAFITATVVLKPGPDASTNGNIRIQYEEIGADFGPIDESTIGIENVDGTLGVQYLFDGTGGPVLDGGAPMALVFGPDASALPVELAAFDAVAASEQEVDLAWQTASETNNAGFYVEHRRLAPMAPPPTARLLPRSGATSASWRAPARPPRRRATASAPRASPRAATPSACARSTSTARPRSQKRSRRTCSFGVRTRCRAPTRTRSPSARSST